MKEQLTLHDKEMKLRDLFGSKRFIDIKQGAQMSLPNAQHSKIINLLYNYNFNNN